MAELFDGQPSPEEKEVKTFESILQEAERIINGPRRDAYGDAKTSFDIIASGWSELFGGPVTGTDVAIAMVWLKMCRFKQSRDRDSLVDICGYTALAARLEGIDD